MTDRPDPIDERLQGYAARWRDALPPPPAMPTDLPNASGQGRRGWVVTRWLPIVAAAAVLAVVVVAVRLGQGGSELGTVGGPTASATTTATSSATSSATTTHVPPAPGVVPWAPLPDTNPTIPTTTVPASPDPALAQGLPVCRAADLTATGEVGGAAGTTYLFVRLVGGAGASPCRLEGYPTVVSLDKGAVVSIPSERETSTFDAPGGVYPHPVLVSAEQPAVVTFRWANWCATAVRQSDIRLTWSGSAGSVTAPGFGGSPGCQMGPGTVVKSPIRLSTFAPVEVVPEHVQTAYAGVTATMDAPSVVSVGEPFRVTITLTAPRDLPLDPCPDILLGDYAPTPDIHDYRYGLNCAAVPYRDSAGRPYLPANVAVPFAAVIPAASAPGAAKLLWRLVLPDGVDPVVAGGSAQVQ